MPTAKHLTASFVVTLVACSAAGPTSVNPPEPTPEPAPLPANPPGREIGGPATPPDEKPDEKPEPDTKDLPTPEPNDKVVAKKDGTCWVYPDIDCPPPPVTCNPPPPRQVQCPAEE